MLFPRLRQLPSAARRLRFRKGRQVRPFRQWRRFRETTDRLD